MGVPNAVPDHFFSPCVECVAQVAARCRCHGTKQAVACTQQRSGAVAKDARHCCSNYVGWLLHPSHPRCDQAHVCTPHYTPRCSALSMKWEWLVVVIMVMLLAMSTVTTAQHPVRERRAQMRIRKREEARAKWEREHKALPQRDRVQECTASGRCFYRGLQAALVEGHGLMFCKDCPDPHTEGSHMETWEARYSPGGFHVDGEIVFTVPNDASTEVLNVVGGAIALIERGKVPFATKVRHAQEAGANAVIIIDDGTCSDNFECGGWIGSKSQGPLARRDAAEAWRGIYIPSVLITKRQSERLLHLMELVTIDIPGLGVQVYVE